MPKPMKGTCHLLTRYRESPKGARRCVEADDSTLEVQAERFVVRLHSFQLCYAGFYRYLEMRFRVFSPGMNLGGTTGAVESRP